MADFADRSFFQGIRVMRQNPKSSSIEKVMSKHEAAIMAIPGVTGIGIGIGDQQSGLVIKVYVERKTPELEMRIPKELEGYPVKTEETGEFRAF